MSTYVFLTLGAITVGIDSEASYPDAMDDITNRAKSLLHEGLEYCKEYGIDPMLEGSFVPDGEDDEYED